MNNRVLDLRLARMSARSALSRQANGPHQPALTMPANGRGHPLRLVTTRDASGDATTAAVGDSDRYEAMFLANLDVVESVIRYVCQRHSVAGADADELGSEVKVRQPT